MKKLIAAILIILMISLLSITSFAQVLPEGYPPTQEDLDNQTVADQLQQHIERNATDPDLAGCIYEKLLNHCWSLSFDHNIDWSMRYHTYTFKDNSSMELVLSNKGKVLIAIFI